MANSNSAKGNPAFKRMSNPSNRNKRIRNAAKNEALRKRGKHPKQIKAAEQAERQAVNELLNRRHGQGAQMDIETARTCVLPDRSIAEMALD